MKSAHGSVFTHDFLLLMAGPVVWAVHFVAIYGFIGVVCARPASQAQWLGVGWAGWVVVAMGLVAAGALVAWLRVRPASAEPHNHRFLQRCSQALGWLALLAIAWETLAVFLVPGCAPSLRG